MKRLESLSILVPAYQDGSTIGKVIDQAEQIGSQVSEKLEIIVINDGSTDQTADTLERLKSARPSLRVITHRQNQGYGLTIRQLYYAGKYRWLFTSPGDYQIDPHEISKLLPFLSKYDLVIGWRKTRQDPVRRIFQSEIYNFLVRLLFRVPVHDVNSVRLMRQDILRSVRLRSKSAFVDAELVIKAKKAGFRIGEAVIAHLPREGGGANGGKWWTILPTIGEMVKFWFRSLKS